MGAEWQAGTVGIQEARVLRRSKLHAVDERRLLKDSSPISTCTNTLDSKTNDEAERGIHNLKYQIGWSKLSTCLNASRVGSQ